VSFSLGIGVHPHAALNGQGERCDGQTRGPLRRMAMRDGQKFVTGKDRIGWRSDDPSDAFGGEFEPEVWPVGGVEIDRDYWPAIREAAKVIGAGPLAKRLGKTERAVRLWLDGSRTPAEPREVAAAAPGCLAEIDPTLMALLGFGYEAGNEAICAALPAFAATLQGFVAAALDFFVRAGGLRETGRGADIPKSTLGEWRGGPEIFGAKSRRSARRARQPPGSAARHAQSSSPRGEGFRSGRMPWAIFGRSTPR
jgi:hypothetical protein